MSILQTPRLRLRPYTPADLDALHALWTEPAVRKYLFDDELVTRDFVENEIASSTAHFAAHGYGQWIFEAKGEGTLVGFGGYRAFFEPPELQLLVGLVPACWGQGYAAEGLGALIRYGFETLGFDEILACADVPNAASRRLIERLGFRFRDRAIRDGADTMCFTLARGDAGQD